MKKNNKTFRHMDNTIDEQVENLRRNVTKLGSTYFAKNETDEKKVSEQLKNLEVEMWKVMEVTNFPQEYLKKELNVAQCLERYCQQIRLQAVSEMNLCCIEEEILFKKKLDEYEWLVWQYKTLQSNQ